MSVSSYLHTKVDKAQFMQGFVGRCIAFTLTLIATQSNAKKDRLASYPCASLHCVLASGHENLLHFTSSTQNIVLHNALCHTVN